jgi:hypothetical protein
LRSKKLVFSVRPPQTTEDLLDASRHCWCGETLQALGPDGEIVAPEDCRAPRACHKPYLAGRDGGGTP